MFSFYRAKHPKLKHTCKVCGKGFPFKFALKEHERNHTGERPLFCDQCGKSFAQRSILHTHVKAVHKNIRPHKCDQCDIVCTTKTGLKMHMRTHTGEKPFSCVVCGKNFSRKGDCKIHQKRIHGKEAEPLEAESLAVEGNFVL